MRADRIFKYHCRLCMTVNAITIAGIYFPKVQTPKLLPDLGLRQYIELHEMVQWRPYRFSWSQGDKSTAAAPGILGHLSMKQ